MLPKTGFFLQYCCLPQFPLMKANMKWQLAPLQDPHFSLLLVILQSPAMPTVPRERIRPLTSQENPAGPFHDPEGRPLKPVARVLLERIARKVVLCTSLQRRSQQECDRSTAVLILQAV